MRTNVVGILVTSLFFLSGFTGHAQSFTGEKTQWHGFDRYDFVINETSLQIKPLTATPQERNGVKAPEKGTRRCIVVVPKQAAEGNPWSWRGCYWDHAPQAEIELLKRGFHIAFITTDPDETWDVWYRFLTEEHGLSPKPAFIGMSRGGANAYTWGTAHPDRVSAICADNPGLSHASLM
ncbi:MAG: alpha/beta hydrolase, partial [Tannerella sp.]|nr:alpha/beta hydrolase [Tannerella sp.]